jgi:hypothetical protein
MKLSFSRNVEFTPTFNGNEQLPLEQQIKMRLKPLDLAELAFVGEIIKEIGLDKEDAKQEIASPKMRALANDLSALLKGHVLELKNLEDADGAVPIDRLALDVPYVSLALETIVRLASISAPGEADTKNSKALPV